MISSEQRKEQILARVNTEGYVQVTALAEMLGVTTATIRSDLTEMEKDGLLHRVHGSAMSVSPIATERLLLDKEKENIDKKKRIGKAAQKFLCGVDNIFVLSGSTVMAFVKEMDHSLNMSVFTVSLPTASHICSYPNISVHFLGGVVHHQSLSVRGEYSSQMIDSINIPLLFLGADGLSDDMVTCSNVEEAIFTKRLVSSSMKTILLCDSSKFGRSGVGRICSYSDIDVLITDSDILPSDLDALRRSGVEVITV